MSRRKRRGLTLVELIAVIVLTLAILVVLALFPTRHGMDARMRSQSNLKQLVTDLIIYAVDNEDLLLNPFDAAGSPDDPWRLELSGTVPSPAYAPADSYSYMFPAVVCLYDPTLDDAVIAPLDSQSWQRHQRERSKTNLLPCSYWYSATAYYSPSRFADSDSGSTAVGATWDRIQRNRLDDVAFAADKVLLFEKQDFGHPEKLLFSHPEAVVALAAADGHVELSSDRRRVGVAEGDVALAPSGGNWADPNLADYGMDSEEEGLARQQALYPAFYHWTRDGIQGRDLY